MSSPARQNNGLARVALVLVALAIAMRVLVPAGFMPGRAGESAIVLCTASGQQTIHLDANGARVDEDRVPVDKRSGKALSDHPCSFAGATHALAGAAPIGTSPRIAPIANAALRPPFTLAPGRGLAAPPPPSTGPPLYV